MVPDVPWPLFRTPYNHDVKAWSDKCSVRVVGPSMTVVSQAEDADINVMMQRFGVTGKMPENPRVPSYGDFTEVTDYRSALDAVRAAEEGFMAIPAKVRAEFDNDPQKLLLFASNPANLARMRELGLAKEVVNVGVAGGSNSSPGGGGEAAGGAAAGNPGGAQGGSGVSGGAGSVAAKT